MLIQLLREATIKAVIKFIREAVILFFGEHHYHVCDKDTPFTNLRSHKFIFLATEYGINLYYSPFYHALANFAERVNRVNKSLISSFIKDNHKQWDKHLPELSCSI